ncbi:MAG: acyltransferase family protein [Deltaproteobacteria bacterium]|nr:acyltransferase family protein [Deltaproteobacteria bacterium]NND28824.1 acyltransferase family protein [Myxococcales bacterium]MBT8463480.1 acyltransferase family protein [Deltaproteobacteria bacterium]MBT8482556.1 acyltransferase family protein [Deltaproteobacteria bacterium]NNK07210.1 acyltransferase family protein [Myxococcales bacterium]
MRMTERSKSSPQPLDPEAYERLLQRVSFLHQWFQPTVEGLENIPREQGALIVTNHGHFGIDLPVLLRLILEGTGRIVRSLGDRVVFALPVFRDLAHSMGAIEGEPEATVQLLQDDQLVLVYPGGAKEALSGPEDAYRLQWESSHGFIRTALRAQKPIIPIAGLGNEELYVQVVSQDRVRQSGVGRFISQLLGDKYVMPIYMGLGALPFPTDLHYIIGEPIDLPHGPEAAEDPNIVAELHRRVTETTQRLIYEGLDQRERDAAAAGADTDAVARGARD